MLHCLQMLMAEVEVGEVLADAVQLETTNRTEDVAVLSHSMEVEVEDEGKEEMPPKAMSSSPSSTTYIPSAAASVPLPYSLPLPVSSSAMRTDMSCLAYQLIHPDMRSIDREMRFRESVTSTYAKGLLSLATANGIVFAPKHTPSSSSSFTPSSSSTSFNPSSSCSSSSTTGIGLQCASSGDWQRRYPPMNGNESGGGRESSGESEEDKAMMLLMQPMQALLDGTLLSAVSWQCRFVGNRTTQTSVNPPICHLQRQFLTAYTSANHPHTSSLIILVNVKSDFRACCTLSYRWLPPFMRCNLNVKS